MIDLKMKIAMNDNDRNIMIYKTSSVMMIVIIILGLLLAIVLGASISTMLSKQVKKIDLFAKGLGNGDLTQILSVDTEDEIGSIAKALNRSCENIKELVSEIIKSSKAVSSVSQEMTAITEEISSEMETINQSVEHISKGAEDFK
jgi:methyl-accepting chemotaxis protein